MPMIRCGDCDGIDFFVLEQLSNIHVRFRSPLAKVFDVFQALAQHPFVNVTQSGNFRSRYFRKTADVILATAARSANGYANTVVRTQYSSTQCECCCSDCDCFSSRSYESTTIDFHIFCSLEPETNVCW